MHSLVQQIFIEWPQFRHCSIHHRGQEHSCPRGVMLEVREGMSSFPPGGGPSVTPVEQPAWTHLAVASWGLCYIPARFGCLCGGHFLGRTFDFYVDLPHSCKTALRTWSSQSSHP